MGWALDFGGTTLDDVDKSGGYPPDGFYRAKLFAAETDKDDGSMSLRFKICHGPQSNRMVRGKITNPQFCDTAEKQKVAANRARIFAVRLGLVGKAAEGKTADVDFTRAVGREVVIKLKTRSFEGKNGKAEFQDLDFAGIYPLDHGDLDGPTRTALGLPLLPGQNATAPTAGSAGKASADKVASPAPPRNADELAKNLWG